MAIRTIIVIVLFAVAAVLFLVVIGVVLLLLAVVAVALILERRLAPLRPQRLARLSHAARYLPMPAVVHRVVDRTAAPRGPPECVQSLT